jgi:hypothetical protein
MSKNHFSIALEDRGIPKRLGMAVVRQLGYSNPPNLKEDNEASGTLSNISNHGIDGGYCGFIYYTDTNEFYRKNKKAIVEMAEEMADSLGENVIEMVCGFNCFKGGTHQERRELQAEVARALYGRSKQDGYWNVPNALAWFAGEEVAKAWGDYVYEAKND